MPKHNPSLDNHAAWQICMFNELVIFAGLKSSSLAQVGELREWQHSRTKQKSAEKAFKSEYIWVWNDMAQRLSTRKQMESSAWSQGHSDPFQYTSWIESSQKKWLSECVPLDFSTFHKWIPKFVPRFRETKIDPSKGSNGLERVFRIEEIVGPWLCPGFCWRWSKDGICHKVVFDRNKSCWCIGIWNDMQVCSMHAMWYV